MADPTATKEEPKKRRGRSALGSGWDWAKGKLSDSKLLATIAGVVATGIGMAGLAISEADLRHRVGVIEAPQRLAPVFDRLDGLDSAVAALKKKDPVALLSPHVEELAAQVGNLKGLVDGNNSAPPPAVESPGPSTTTTTYNNASPITDRLGAAERKLTDLSAALAAGGTTSESMTAILTSVQADLSAIKATLAAQAGLISTAQAAADAAKAAAAQAQAAADMVNTFVPHHFAVGTLGQPMTVSDTPPDNTKTVQVGTYTASADGNYMFQIQAQDNNCNSDQVALQLDGKDVFASGFFNYNNACLTNSYAGVVAITAGIHQVGIRLTCQQSNGACGFQAFASIGRSQ